MVGKYRAYDGNLLFPNPQHAHFQSAGVALMKGEMLRKNEIIINKRGYACASPVSFAKALSIETQPL
jgi:hypothetical protein